MGNLAKMMGQQTAGSQTPGETDKLGVKPTDPQQQQALMDLMKASQGGLFQGQDLQSTFLGRRR
jgi:hypothetical protein